MNARRTLLSLSALAASTAALTAPANAAAGLAMWPLALVSAYTSTYPAAHTGAAAQCAPFAQTASLSGTSDKITALLGGQPSSLERIRLQQAGAGATTGLVSAQSAAPAGTGTGCAGFVAPAPRLAAMTGQITAQPQHPLLNPDDFLASRRLSVQHTEFDSAWDRVRSHGLSRRHVVELTGISGSPENEDVLLTVNRWVNRRIRYVDDQAQYGRADYWSNAASTLKHAEGDCEDIAIVKMQMLAALGVPQDKMFLTIARDQVRGGSHALLIVNIGGNYRMLDDSTDAVLDGRQANDYMPILSFSQNHKWLHGF